MICGCKDKSTSYEVIELPPDEIQFVWKAMNMWYYWRDDVQVLSDDQFSGLDLYDFLNGFSDGRELFDYMLKDGDRFSRFGDNYDEFLLSFQGIRKSSGYRSRFIIQDNGHDMFSYITYVIPDSPADDAGLKRGDIYTRVNGIRLNVDNYSGVYNSDDNILTLAVIEDGIIKETDETVSVSRVTLQENPIHTAKVLDIGSKKVGYMVLNSFSINFNRELNDVFGLFKSEQIDELILDLRYNGGGHIAVSNLLAGLISGKGQSNIFAQYIHNTKQSERNYTSNFLDQVMVFDDQWNVVDRLPMNQLFLDQVFVLTSRNTASASEMLINGLGPYLNVVLIGLDTFGKDVGQYFLYDSPQSDYLWMAGDLNTSHKLILFPISFRVLNSDMMGYPNGFIPDYQVIEVNYLENLPPLGNINEPLLAKALDLIAGTDHFAQIEPSKYFQNLLPEPIVGEEYEMDMYVLPFELNQE